MKRTAASILLLASLLLAVSSCGESGTGPVSTDEASASPETETEVGTDDGSPKLELPETNYNGSDFHILSSSSYEYEFITAENGDIVDDAVYARSRSVEELLNIKLISEIRPGSWADRDSFNAITRNSILAEDGAFSLLVSSCAVSLPLSSEGMFCEVGDLTYVDFSKPWWTKDIVDAIGINGKLYAFIGDAALSMYRNFAVLYFNKKLIDDYDLLNPYEAVYSDNWTLDTFHSLAKSVGADLNGDDKITETDDLLGLLYADVPNRAMQTALEFRVVDLDDKNIPYLVPLTDRDAELYEKQYQFMREYKYIWGADTKDHEMLASIFGENRALFLCEYLTAAAYMRDMVSDYGIVPMPKYDKAQKDYHTQINTGASMFFVPVTVEDIDLTSMVCEALSYYSYRDVIPVYYETTLKDKYSRDDDVRKMLTLIRDSACLTFAFTYSTVLSPMPNVLLPTSIKDTGRELASSLEAKRKQWESEIESIVATYEANNT